MAHVVSVEWSLRKSPDLILEIWTTESMIEAVLAALLAEPENLEKAIRALRGTP